MSQLGIERCTEVDVLREQYSAKRIGGTVVLVESVNARNAYLLHRQFLNSAYYLLPLLRSLGNRTGRVEHRANLILCDGVVNLLLVQLELAVLPLAKHVDREFGHLAYLLIERHFA